jgi:hypothetical protein
MNKYPSKYSNGKEVSAAQYLAELVCERLAIKRKIDLHYRFWLNKEWEKEYKGQIAAANKLLKRFELRFVIQALKTDRGQKIYSLRAPHLPSIIEQMELQPDKQPVVVKDIQRNFLDKGKETKSKLNILDKLKEIDNGPTR